MPTKNYKVIDLFSGCGGLTKGFLSAGYKLAYAIESDPSAIATFAANFGEESLFPGDITRLPKSYLPGADIVVGGPPCQGFSRLGKSDPNDPRSTLWRDFLNVVKVVRPSHFVMENVASFLGSNQYTQFRKAMRASKYLRDYVFDVRIMNTANYGVPQKRRRAIIIASRSSEVSFPEPTHSPDSTFGWVSLKEALHGIPDKATSDGLPVRQNNSNISGPYTSSELHISLPPTELGLARYKCIPPGGSRFNLPDDLKPDCWIVNKTGFSDVLGRLKWEEPAVTIRTEFWKPEKGRYLHPEWVPDNPAAQINRALTHWEAARIQTFPDDFLWYGTRVQIGAQIGNAVPPLFAKQIADHILTNFDFAQ